MKLDVELAAAVSALTDNSAAPTIAPIPSLIALADAIDGIYVAVEEWVRYGFEVAADVVAWIPWVGIFANQIMVVYNFVESLINSGVFNTTDWLRGQGTALKNVADWVVDLGLALVWLGIDEIGAWIPLPPIDGYPPRPPAADLPEGFLGDAVVGASHVLADVSHAIWNIWEPIKSGVGWGVDAASDLLSAVSWIPFVPLIDFELTAGWDLIAGEIDALTGFAHDMIDAGDQFVVDTFQGDGLIAAIVNAFDNTVASIVARSGEAWQTFTDWIEAQVDFFFNPAAQEVSQEDSQEMEVSAATVGTTETDESAGGNVEGAGEDDVEKNSEPSGSESSSAGDESGDEPPTRKLSDHDETLEDDADAGDQGDGAPAPQEESDTEVEEDAESVAESADTADGEGTSDEPGADGKSAEAG
ncbi:hypothetical protein [Mycobacterium sp. 236(2023)]|uniref:hypothetical protein n=1 Tax=Mycobacterium sp. 236(2023) TaxID=3038163 RepID=UPI002415751B|nr:hypothetical protein [Mycobacterium sp. 236(2023)]MDG4666330.1 hypothetical protein [Mycobacterium sp. 236(2023)]